MSDWLSGQFVKKEKTLDNFVNSSLPTLAAYWEYMQRIKPTSTLPKLALRIF
ncbi:hypothetical protein F441_21030 [Phytophthora nicotianae CJ01A1]|uniref:Uncharacterized protein n=5 Tax=Phytophthora nicotianae TaxID=4792 RepID=V9E0Y0_PHYNI|nr:hypothetical protein F443_21154 [Phytophthora nicotianae P1569]ETK72302.1 hypothetical protein L915_20578 [Phytophthora nicotianae]ETO60664.1 hypothetical protein F444_21175 [Phytophthora nicotianae P1976]ETP01783.1 hypothetical protein F441_21030 [Phytophthora nicotianae CJ01A1]ETP29934.1 hypothetical protein F442_20982 [Phytophthora nicotianae P10297]